LRQKRPITAAGRGSAVTQEVPVIRMIKRYGSRKLYDTEESRYVSLEEIGAWVREGQEIRVVDNDSDEDVTAQTLTQVILEEGRRGTSYPPKEVLHELIRRGEKLVSSGVGQLQSGVDRLLQASVDRLAPIRHIREETAVLRQRLEELESSLERLESAPPPGPVPAGNAGDEQREAENEKNDEGEA
jgi:polyhydroxyalkanoate synthesis repressor PhaR